MRKEFQPSRFVVGGIDGWLCCCGGKIKRCLFSETEICYFLRQRPENTSFIRKSDLKLGSPMVRRYILWLWRCVSLRSLRALRESLGVLRPQSSRIERESW